MSININILPQGTLAIYEQIIMQLKNAIVTGELKSGEALPSIRAYPLGCRKRILCV